MLLELAVGDAYGAGFEYADNGFINCCNDLSRYVKHPRHAIVPGCYTDDAQMSIAVAEALVSGEKWTPLLLASHFVEAFKRDPREGYAGGFYQFLQHVQNGSQFLTEIKPDSDKSGAAMRAAPIGVLPDTRQVIEYTAIQAAITHNTPDGINAAIAAALMTHFFIYNRGPKSELGIYLEKHVEGDWAQTWQGKVKAKGWMSVRAAVTAVVQHNSMSTILKNCIAFSGDVDTVATIALAAASCSCEVEQDLPENLVWCLENRTYGKDYLAQLDTRLMSLVMAA